MAKVNLDALIPREDFEVIEVINSGKKKDTISIEDLKSDSFFFTNVRKPDFQRETNEWTGQKICDFIESFVEEDLIPAIILWRSNSGFIFVIDGSHRLSSLSSWINDDYGDGKISKLFYDGIVPDDQIKIAEETRRIVRKKVGTYEDFKLALSYPEKVRPDILRRAKNLAALAIQLQWVEGGASKAENSFFKINQQAAPIDTTELVLLESRKKPNCIAARAIIRGGKGHKYWSKFTTEIQDKIQDLAKEINEILFSPQLQTPIKTLDIPIGGRLYSGQTLPLILDFVNIVNNIGSDFKNSLPDDETGEETIRMLLSVRKVSYRINSDHPSSFGLHPIVYFYSQEGKYKVTSFYAIVSLLLDLERKNAYKEFIISRERFEKLIQKYDYVIQQINRKYRSSHASYPYIKDFYFKSIILLSSDLNLTEDQVISSLLSETEYSYLTLQLSQEEITKTEFTSERKSAVFIKEAMASAPKCQICQGLIHRNSISIDHIVRKSEGGLGTVDNGQITHPYCNTTFKN